MEQHRFNQYLLASAEFYEPISKYRANEDDFFSLASSFLPDAWNVARYNYWYSCMPPRAGIPFQGWKIHVSTEYRRAREILKAVVPVLVQDEVPFKYTADARLLRLHNGKSWPRGKSGKFVTIYPRDERHFLKLAARLHEATREFKGPRVLSDRRYPGSSVLHYRYGTLRPGDRTCITGEPSSLLTAPDGSTVDDERLPYFRLPSWIHDPINGNNATSSTPKQGAITLKDGRYRVENALSFSNTGGVYRAHDQRTGASSASVVVKEARPHVESTPGGSDSVTRLKKEYRILNYCKVNRIAPAPIDLFEESEHWFLIQEYFAGIPLSRHSARTNPMLSANPSLEERQGFLDAFGSIFTAVAGALQFLHSKGVVVGDLSPNNILVQPNTLDVRLIDFEAACESGVDEPAPLLTPGFVPPEQRRRSWTPRQPDDLYALGAVMSSYLYPVNNIYALNPAAKRVFVGESTFALGFPKDIEVLILNLLADRPECRPTLDEVIETLGGRGRRTLQLTRTETLGREAGRSGRLRTRAASIAQYIVSTADFGRSDRLFPADPRVYNGNPLSVAYGASGVAYVLKEMTGSCPQPVVDWIMDRLMEGPAPPPGLYVGSALAGRAFGIRQAPCCRTGVTAAPELGWWSSGTC